MAAPASPPSPAALLAVSPTRSPGVLPVVLLAFAALPVLGGCGNRGELFLEPSVDTATGTGLEALEGAGPADGLDLVPDGEPAVAPAAEPSPLLPDEGIAPTVDPDVTSAPEDDGPDRGEDDEDDEGEGS